MITLPGGVAVTRLSLEQKFLGSNPSPAANLEPIYYVGTFDTIWNMSATFSHNAINLQNKKPIVFTALSKKYFYMRMFVVKYVLEQGKVPINPFTSFDYYLLDVVDRDTIRNANNNLVATADELWTFGTISNGVMAEIKQALKQGKPVRYFSIENDKDIREVSLDDLVFEDGMERFKEELLKS